MIKKAIMVFTALLSIFFFSGAIACPQATVNTDQAFCSSFKEAAICHCTSSGLPKRMCNDMKLIYERMLIVFHTVEKACEYQHDTTTQNCIDAWKCYRNGGNNSQNQLCSGTGSACA